MAGTVKRLAGPAFLAAAAANIYNSSDALLRTIVTRIHINNKTGGAVVAALYLGATGGSASGTEILGPNKSIPANDTFDYYCNMAMSSAEFLTGLAGAANSLIITVEGYQVVI